MQKLERRAAILIVSLSSIILALLTACSREAEHVPAPATVAVAPSSNDLMSRIYGNKDSKSGCWFIKREEQTFCLKVARFDPLKVGDEHRYYLLAKGYVSDEKGNENGSHAELGAVGAFVFVDQGGQTIQVAGDKLIAVGSSGQAPEDWKFLQLGPQDYWGWTNTWGDCHQGYCGTRYSILAPYGKGVKDMAGFVASYEDTGTCGDQDCEGKTTSIESTLKVDTSVSDQKVYPLLISVSGNEMDKTLEARTWSFKFDEKKWKYLEPADWPLRDRDF